MFNGVHNLILSGLMLALVCFVDVCVCMFFLLLLWLSRYIVCAAETCPLTTYIEMAVLMVPLMMSLVVSNFVLSF